MKSRLFPMVLYAVGVILLHGLVFTGCKSNNNGDNSGTEEETTPKNPLDIKDKVVFSVKFTTVSHRHMYTNLNTGKKIYQDIYPELGKLSKIELYSDTTGLLVKDDGERNSIRCKYIEDHFQGEIHKAIIFAEPRNSHWAVMITEDYKVKAHIPIQIMSSDSKDVLSYAFELSNNMKPDYVLENETIQNEVNNREEAKEQTIHLIDLSKILVDDYRVEVVEKYLENNYNYVGEDSESLIWCKDCVAKKVKKEVTYAFQDPEMVEMFEPSEINDKSIWITGGAYRGPYTYTITVWGTNNFEDLREQLKSLGYIEKSPGSNDSYWNYKKTEEDMPEVMIEKQDDSYVLRLVGDGDM